MIFGLLVMLLSVSRTYGQRQTPDWQTQVRKDAEAQDWTAAMQVVEQEIARAPQDADVLAWRPRVLAWSGHLAEAENEYLKILNVSRKDPDIWMGLASACLGEGKIEEAERAIDAAVELDPSERTCTPRARLLRAAGERNEARSEFREALSLDPASAEARTGLISVRPEPRNELRSGEDNDLLNYAAGYHDEWTSFVTQWSSRWTTSVAGEFYQRGGTGAGTFVGSITRRQPKWGALTLGGAVGHDNGVIPRSEAFFDLDHGWRTSETGFVRSDSNRLVRLRAAEGLVELKTEMARIFEQVVETRDRYGFHAYLTALENRNLRGELEAGIRASAGILPEEKSVLLNLLQTGALPGIQPVRAGKVAQEAALMQ
jgi:tetratricopeptide (TPR) repeat protein